MILVVFAIILLLCLASYGVWRFIRKSREVIPFYQTSKYVEVAGTYTDDSQMPFRVFCLFLYLQNPKQFLGDPASVAKAKRCFEVGYSIDFDVEPWVKCYVQSNDKKVSFISSSRSQFYTGTRASEVVKTWYVNHIVNHDPGAEFRIARRVEVND